MLAELFKGHNGDQARARPTAWDGVGRDERRVELFTCSAGELLADRLDDFPLARDDRERVGDIFAHLHDPIQHACVANAPETVCRSACAAAKAARRLAISDVASDITNIYHPGAAAANKNRPFFVIYPPSGVSDTATCPRHHATGFSANRPRDRGSERSPRHKDRAPNPAEPAAPECSSPAVYPSRHP
jgi:hypothetical protein